MMRDYEWKMDEGACSSMGEAAAEQGSETTIIKLGIVFNFLRAIKAIRIIREQGRWWSSVCGKVA
jgi:hypothetical protein